jgi:amino acid adenylation domain-containing protein/non-ribosomal peptide synthase protein (TIGR01720 family)
MSTLHQLFQSQVEKTPGRVAVQFGADHLTFEQLEVRSNQLAWELDGLPPESPLGVCLPRGQHLLPTLLAVLKAGGAYLPLDPHYPEERLRFMLEDTQARVITTSEILRRLPFLSQGREVILADRVAEDGPCHSPPVEVNEDALAYIIYTSGSTGRPKGVMGTHRGMVNRFRWMWREFPFQEGEICCAKTSLNFVDSVWELFGPILAGIPLVLIPDGDVRDGLQLAELILDHRISRLVVVPSLLSVLVEAWSGRELHPILVTSSGEALTTGLAQRVLDLPNLRLLNLYGSSEVAADATAIEITREMASDSAFVPIGRPIDGMGVEILDPAGEPCPDGEAGELFVRGPGLARGYFGQPELTSEKFLVRDGIRYFRTGDTVRRLGDGNLSFIGRVDFQVKIRGNRVEPGDVEAAIRSYPGMKACVVVARQLGDAAQLIAYFVSPEVVEVGTLRDFLAGKLPEYMVPSRFRQLESLPLSPNGKIERSALPDLGESLGEIVAPQTERQEMLAAIWREVLNLERVGIHQDFFLLGGDSILSLRVALKARQAGLVVTPAQLKEFSTISQLAELSDEIVTEQGLVVGLAPLTPMQHYYFQWATANPSQFNNAVLFKASQNLNPDTLHQAFRRVVRHHDSLRLRFSKDLEGRWTQRFSADARAFELALTELDLRGLSLEDCVLKIREVCCELQASLDIEAGPVLRAALFRGHPDGSDRLLLAMNHLTHDGTSMQYLFEDLSQVYQDLVQGREAKLPPKSTDFKTWAEALKAYSQSSEIQDEWDYWLRLSPDARTFPLETSADDAKQKDIELLSTVFWEQRELSEYKARQGRGYQKDLYHLLLTALALTAHHRSGQQELLLHLVGHGREGCVRSVDVSRTTGWLVTHTPVQLKLPGDQSRAFHAISAQLDSMPHNGIGHGALRWLSDDPRAAKLAAHDKVFTLFNYEGDLWETSYYGELLGRPCDELVLLPGAVDPENPADYLFYVVVLIVSGRLVIEFFYSRKNFRKETVAEIAEQFKAHLQKLVVSA